MTREEQNRKLKAFITCLKCEVSGKPCDDNCPTQYEAGNMGEIIESLEAISKALEQEPTTKNDLGIDREQLKTMIRSLTKWYVKRDNTKVGEPNTAVGLLYDDVMFGIDRLPSVTPQEPRKGHWIEVTNGRGGHECDVCHDYAPSFQNGNEYLSSFCPNCGAKMAESEDT